MRSYKRSLTSFRQSKLLMGGQGRVTNAHQQVFRPEGKNPQSETKKQGFSSDPQTCSGSQGDDTGLG
jgi:hypothetical protein